MPANRPHSATARRARRLRMVGLEGLEDRRLPATFTVTNTDDSGPGSLRAAIERANMAPDQDTIDFAPAVTGTITLTSPLPDFASDIILTGPGASVLTVARNSAAGTLEFRIFTIGAGAEVEISGLTLSGGRKSSGFEGGGGIDNLGTLTIANTIISNNTTLTSNGSGNGGGVFNSGTLTITNSVVSHNSGTDGGGITNFGTMAVINTTISGNSTVATNAGGILNFRGTLTIADSTITGNSAGFAGGGVFNSTSGIVEITDSTISGNSALFGGGGIGNISSMTITDSTISGNSADDGTGGISNFGGGVLQIANSIVDDPVGGNSVGAVSSGGHNLFSDHPGVRLDPSDLLDTDPLLGPLADNGGPTFTHALLPGSPAIDAGVTVLGVATDQRGVPRAQGSAPDIGAFESRGFTLTISGGDHQTAPGGSPFPAPLVVAVASPFGEPVAGGRVTFVAASTGASAILAGNPATIGSDGRADVGAMANGIGGTYAVTAEANGAAQAVVFTLTNAVAVPPTVTGLRRFGVHLQPTRLVLTFSEPMDAGRAEDLANYALAALGPHGGKRPIRLVAAAYDAASRSVTLRPARLLNLHGRYRLTVVGRPPGGLTSATGLFLAGAGTGQAGTDYVKDFGREVAVLPAPHPRAGQARRLHAGRATAPARMARRS